MKKQPSRCSWPSIDPQMIKYHDTEWGVPLQDDQKFFEFLLLDSFQAGLSWKTILSKRQNFKKAFGNFDPKKISKYSTNDFSHLMKNSGIIRNRLKINAAITNSILFLEIQQEFGTFSTYIWQFTKDKPKINKWTQSSQIPAKSKESDAMSHDLIKKGFKFTGSTICYAFMQASGIVNDHLTTCFRYKELLNIS